MNTKILISSIAVFAILLTAINTGYSQKLIPEKSKTNYRLGGFIHYNYNMYDASFGRLPNVPSCCPEFTDGTGMGFSAGFLFEYPLSDRFFLSGRLGYFDRSGEFEYDETSNRTVVYDYQNDTDVQGTFRHTLETTLGMIAFEPGINYRIWQGLFAHAGAQVGFINLTNDHTHSEQIIEPAVGVFETGTDTRLQSEGEIDDLSSISLGVYGGLSYEIPLDKNSEFILAPEIFYTYGLTDVVQDYEWKAHALRFGLAFKYQPLDFIPPPVEETGGLMGDVNARSVDRNGQEGNVVQINVEEYLASNLKPLLTYIFFEENSSDIPDRYETLSPAETDSFSEDDLYPFDALDTYYHVLNIIGNRMREYPEAKIAIDGCNNNRGPEKGNTELSRNRAEIVRDYLNTVWGIENDRMILGARNLPQEPSNVNDPDGIVENQRVEITSNTWEVIAPVAARDTFRVTNPPTLRFKNEYTAEDGLAEWQITAMQDGKAIKFFNGMQQMPESIDWHMTLDQRHVPRMEGMLDYKMELVDVNGQVYETKTKQIPVEVTTIRQKKREQREGRYIDRFSLILFGFDQAQLSFYNQQVAELINEVVKPDSDILIYGHTDKIGKEDYNKRLSQQRADMVANALKSEDISSTGLGETVERFPNELPEGRFYNRRVDIIVETPVQ